jgi:hypothetical protein
MLAAKLQLFIDKVSTFTAFFFHIHLITHQIVKIFYTLAYKNFTLRILAPNIFDIALPVPLTLYHRGRMVGSRTGPIKKTVVIYRRECALMLIRGRQRKPSWPFTFSLPQTF